VPDDKRSAYVGNRVNGWEHFAQGLFSKAADLTLNWPRLRQDESLGGGFFTDALVEFPSAGDALGAAIEFQRAIAEANRDQPEDTAIVFRIGSHLGDLIVDGDDARRCNCGHRKGFKPRDARSDGAGRDVAGAGRSPMSQGDEFEFQRGAAADPEREQGAEGRQKRKHADDWAAPSNTVHRLTCLAFWSFEQGQSLLRAIPHVGTPRPTGLSQ